jgi:hypothetical protein
MESIMSAVQRTILEKKAALAEAVSAPLGQLAERAAEVWPDADGIDRALTEGIGTVPSCHLMYAWGLDGIELSSMVRPSGPDRAWRGRDLSQRPYLKNHLPFKGIMLSSVYESIYTHRQCITALQAVTRGTTLLGFIAADFALDDLLRDGKISTLDTRWTQYRGDPSVRGTVFLQTRTTSLLDQHIDTVHRTFTQLMTMQGVFHCKIHYSSGRCSLWLYDDPYSYRIHNVDEIINPDICLAYPMRAYPSQARVRPEQVPRVLEEFRHLRFADETIYLRSSSLNIMNAMVGLTFSCDGSHYMPVDEFLEKDLAFWLGVRETRTGT